MRENRIGRPLVVGETTILPLETVKTNHMVRRGTLSTRVSIEPVAVVLCTTNGIMALDMNGLQLPLTDLVDDFPALEEVLDGL
jgi:uncharacterized spore protein YtfJ